MGLDNLSKIINAKKEQMGIDKPIEIDQKKDVSSEIFEVLKLLTVYLQNGLEEISERLEVIEHDQRVLNTEISKVKKKLEIED